jgi:hypothetical protein
MRFATQSNSPVYKYLRITAFSPFISPTQATRGNRWTCQFSVFMKDNCRPSGRWRCRALKPNNSSEFYQPCKGQQLPLMLSGHFRKQKLSDHTISRSKTWWSRSTDQRPIKSEPGIHQNIEFRMKNQPRNTKQFSTNILITSFSECSTQMRDIFLRSSM